MTLPPERAKLNRAYRAAIAKLGLEKDDDIRRDMLETLTGKRSSKECTDAQMRKVLAHLNGSTKDKPFKASGRADVRKIYAIWGALVRDGKADKKGLRGLCSRMANLKNAATTDPEFLTPAKARTVIEALKAMQKREVKTDG